MSSKKKSANGPKSAEQDAAFAEIVPERDAKSFIENFYGDNAKWFIVTAIVLGSIAIYYQAISFNFINLDDNVYVYKNPSVLSGLSWENTKWAFTTFHAANWHPLTWLVHQLTASVAGPNPAGYHLVNIVLHVTNSLVLFFLVSHITGATWKSGLVAMIFAFHPAHIESVAWVAELKDVLSTLFWLLTCLTYVQYVRSDKSRSMYVLALGCFTLGLLAKPMLVTLPFVLLLLDLWPLKRFDRFTLKALLPLIYEKAPFLVLAIASSVVTFMAQRAGGAIVGLVQLTLSERIANAFVSYLKSAAMLFYPVNLGGWYPYNEAGHAGWLVLISFLLVVGTSIYALKEVWKKPYVFTGWFWFTGTLVPVIGLVQVGKQSHADRYTYIPFIGLTIAVIWLAAYVVSQVKLNKDVATAVAGIALVIFGVMSFRQTRIWRNDETFYRHTLSVTTKNYLFEQNYCQFLIDNNRIDEAEVQCRNSIANNPNYVNAWNSMGVIDMKKGRLEDALTDFERSTALLPGDIDSYSNYLNTLIALGRLDEAAEKMAWVANSNAPAGVTSAYLFSLYSLIGYAYGQKNEVGKAIDHLEKAIAINPTQADLHANLGLLLYEAKKPDESIRTLTRSLELNPNQPAIHNAIGKIMIAQGQRSEAIIHFKSALSLDPTFQKAADNLKKAEAEK